MDQQNLISGPSDNQTSANPNVSLKDTGPMQNVNKSQQDFQHSQPQQQFGIKPAEQKSSSYSYASPSIPPNINSADDHHQQQQIVNTIQQDLAPMPQESTKQQQQVQQQHQPAPQQLQQEYQPQLHQPQMPPHHAPIKPLLADDSTITIPNAVPNNAQKHETSGKAVITKVRLSDELNIFDWYRAKEIISQIAEKAKSSVDSVITTLDPGMKEYLYSGGNVNIIIISDNEYLVSPIRDAFQSVFGRATVASARNNPSSMTAPYPIRTACGLQEAIKVAQERIKKLRQNTNSIPQNQVMVAVQPTLISMNVTNIVTKQGPEGGNGGQVPTETTTMKWFLTYCILIEDPVLSVTLNCYSQFIPIDTDIVESAKAVPLPADFPDKHLGFAGTIDELMAYKLRLNPSHGFSDEYGSIWLREWAGIYETQIVHQMSTTLAQSYRIKWNDCAHLDAIS